MKRQDYVLVFPMGMCGKKTINVRVNPLSIRAVVKQIIISQPLVFGCLCIIKDSKENVVGIAHQGKETKVKFYTEDDDIVEQIKGTEDLQ